MAEIIVWSIIFIASLAVLIKSSGFFTNAASSIGIRWGMPPFIVGVTIVALGTSLPELVSSIVAVLRGASEIVVGNVVGSNITNIFLILAIAAIMAKKLRITFALTHVDLPILVASALLMGLVVWDGSLTAFEGILLLFGLVIYIHYTLSSGQRKQKSEIAKEVKKHNIKGSAFKQWIIIAISAVFIYVGAKYTIDSVLVLSNLFNIGTEIIAVSVVALGTSLPELAVTISAARQGKEELAIGNILGSNIFNTFAVMGIPALFGTLLVPASILSFALPVMIIGTLLFFFITQEQYVTGWEGWFLLLFYVFFIGKVFGLL